MTISHVEICESCGEELHMEVPLPEQNFDIHVYGTTIVKEFKDRIEISLSDWEKIKGRLIPAMKREGINATGNNETEARV